MPKILLIFILRNLEINFIDSLNNKSDISFVLHILIKISTKLLIPGDLYSHRLHTYPIIQKKVHLILSEIFLLLLLVLFSFCSNISPTELIKSVR